MYQELRLKKERGRVGEDNIKVNLEKLGQLTQDKTQWWNFVNTMMKIRKPWWQEMCRQPHGNKLPKEDHVPRGCK